jgi:hypothetical protein
MRAVGVLGMASASIALCSAVGLATPAAASNYGVELNGRYRVTSNGDWAQTNLVDMDEKTVVQTWTINTSCTSPIMCTGTVTSDQGWTAPAINTGEYWIVDRVVPNWEPCPDGTAAPGDQKFRFWGQDPVGGWTDPNNVNLLAGQDRTIAASGACGVNKPLVIQMPVKLEKLP